MLKFLLQPQSKISTCLPLCSWEQHLKWKMIQPPPTPSLETQISTICLVCGGGDDEDMVLLCDSPGCHSEIHLYCLQPVLTAIPEGSWYCPLCEERSTSKSLEHCLTDHVRGLDRLQNRDELREYVVHRQLTVCPLRKLNFTKYSKIQKSEFDTSDARLLGMSIQVFCDGWLGYQHGRIINRRFQKKCLDWEHLLMFNR